MSSIYDDQEIEITCKKCGTKIRKTIGWIKAQDNQVVCTCGTIIGIDVNHFKTDAGQAEKALDDFKKGLKKLKK